MSDYLKNEGDPLTLDADYDAAIAYRGSDWRMPTEAEFRELIDNTTREWTTVNGVTGYKFTSNTNGNSIFLPAAGHRTGTSFYRQGLYGYYWSKELNPNNRNNARYMYFYSGGVNIGNYQRYYGLPIRPVYVGN